MPWSTTTLHILQFINCSHHSPGLLPYPFARLTGQTCNSQAANYESWMVRYPPYTPGFSHEQSARPNYHAMIYHLVANCRLAMLVWAQSSTDLAIFLFPVITLNNFLCPTMPQHSAISIHQVDQADTLGRIAPQSSPSCFHPILLPSHEGFLAIR